MIPSGLFLVVLLFLTASATREKQYVTIGALVSSKLQEEIFLDLLKNASNSQIHFTAYTDVLDKNPLTASDQACKFFTLGKGRLMAIVVDQPNELYRAATTAVSFTCSGYSMILMASNSRNSDLSDRYAHTTMLRSMSSYAQEAILLAALIQKMEWKEVVVVHSGDYEGRVVLTRLEAATDGGKIFKVANTIEITESLEESISGVPVNITDLLQPLATGQHRVIVLIVSSSNLAIKVYEAATVLGIMHREWVWLATEKGINVNPLPQGVLGVRLMPIDTTDFFIDSVSVIVAGFQYYVNLTIRNPNFASLNKIISPTTCESTIKYEDFGQFSLNTLYAMIRGIHIYDGRTGPVGFDGVGERSYPSYDIVNSKFTGSGESPEKVVVGNFDNSNPKILESAHSVDPRNMFVKHLLINMSEIVWPGDAQYNKTVNKCVEYNATTGHCLAKKTEEVFAAPDSVIQKLTLKVVTITDTPFVYKRERPHKGCDLADPLGEYKLKKEVDCNHIDPKTGKVTNYCCRGYCIDLLRRLSNRKDIEDNYTPFDFKLHLVGDGVVGDPVTTNGTKRWNGIMEEILSGTQADLSVAPITITPERAEVVGFTKPFKYLGLTILIKREKTRSNLDSFLLPFEDTLWVLVGVSVHVVALILYLLDRFSPFGRFKLSKSSSTEEDALNLSSAMWFAWGVLLNSGIGEGTPRSFSARVLGMVWAGFAMIIVASYTANLAAFLVLDRPEASISGIDDARLRNPQKDFTFATVSDSPVELYFKRQVEYATMYRTMIQKDYKTLEEAIHAVKTEKLKAFIWYSSRLDYEASEDCSLVTVGEVFGRTGYGLAMRKGSRWLEDFSQAILNFHEKGFMEALDSEWILSSSAKCDSTDTSPATLGLGNMASVFIIVGAGILFGIGLILIEIAYKRQRGSRERQLGAAKQAADKWRDNIAKRKLFRRNESTSEETETVNGGAPVPVVAGDVVIGPSEVSVVLDNERPSGYYDNEGIQTEVYNADLNHI